MDVLNKIYGLSFMDAFHDYRDKLIWRYHHRQRAKFVSNNIDEYVKSNSIVLDAACGKGPYSYLSGVRSQKVYSFDVSEKELNRAKENIKKMMGTADNVLFSKIDLREIPLSDEEIDVVVLSEALEHIPDHEKAFSEICRVLKPGGVIIFTMPNSWSFFWQFQRIYFNLVKLLKRSTFEQDYDFYDVSMHWKFPFWKIKNIVKAKDLKIIKKEGSFILPVSPGIIDLLIRKFPRGFMIYDKLDRFLSRKIPYLSAFYLMVLQK